MSRHLITVQGHEERPNFADNTVEYYPNYLSVTTFYGGEGRGTCIQISLDNNHIQLTRDKVLSLKDELEDWLNLTK